VYEQFGLPSFTCVTWMLQLKDDFTHQPSILLPISPWSPQQLFISSSSPPLSFYFRMQYQLKIKLSFHQAEPLNVFHRLQILSNYEKYYWSWWLQNISLTNKYVCTNCTHSCFKESLKSHYQTMNERTGETGIGSLSPSVGNTALHIKHTTRFLF
jgi:hypothetical protein